MATDDLRLQGGDRSGDSFLEHLLSYESGIFLDRHQWYVENLDTPVMEYPVVRRPGRVVRDPGTGRHATASSTVAEYFRALGVDRIFDMSDPSCLRVMQYESMNPWGHFGYQFGEECLNALGYYEYERVRLNSGSGAADYARYYRGGLDPRTWVGDRTELRNDDECAIFTDVNEWKGRFTGKRGVESFADLVSPAHQEFIIRELASFNLHELHSTVVQSGRALEEFLDHEWHWKGTAVSCSWSGLIACCHLVGPHSTARFLLSAEMYEDDLGTGVLDYMNRFGHYRVAEIIDLADAFVGDG